MESAVKTVAGAAKKAVNAFATDAFTVSGGSGLVSTSTRGHALAPGDDSLQERGSAL